VIPAEKSTLAGVSIFVNLPVNNSPNSTKVLIGKRILLMLKLEDRELGRCSNLNHVKFVVLKNLSDITLMEIH